MANVILKEAFDSAPYEVSYEIKPPAAEWYNFEEDSTHQYRIEVNSPTQAKAGKLGKNVKVIRIGFKSSGTNFRPVIGKFKDAKRVIATILDILNKYKAEGKYGNKIQGFALQFKASAFGPYAKLVKRIARMYLRQQFKVSDSDWSPNEDQSYVWLVRKGKKFSDVFDGIDVVSKGVDLDASAAAHGEVHTPTDTQPEANDPISQLSPTEHIFKFVIGQYYVKSIESGSPDKYYKIVDTGVYVGQPYYTVNIFNAWNDDLIGDRVNISAIAAENTLVPYSTSTPVQSTTSVEPEKTHKYKVGDLLSSNGLTFYMKIVSLTKTTQGDLAYNVEYHRKSDDSILSGGGVSHLSLETSIDDMGVTKYTPGQVATSFKIGDFTELKATNSKYYYKVVSIKDGTAKLDVYEKSNRLAYNRGIPISEVELNSQHKKYDPIIKTEEARYKIGQWFYDKDFGNYYKIADISSGKYMIEVYDENNLNEIPDTLTWSILYVETDTEDVLGVESSGPAELVDPIEGALTKEEHMQSLLAAASKYDIVIDNRDQIVKQLIEFCPHVSVEDICEAFFGEPGGNPGSRKLKINSSGVIIISQSNGDLYGSPLAQMSRNIDLKNQYVYHDYLAMQPSSQGGGATKALFKNCVPLYEKMGLKKIKVYANIQVGAAVWAKYGFKDSGDESSYRYKVKSHLDRLKYLKQSIEKSSDYTITHQLELDGIESILKTLQEKPYFADWPAYICSLTCPNVETDFQKEIKEYCDRASDKVDVSIGKFLNWGMSYNGELVFSDKQSYNRMAKYTGLPRKE